MAKKEIFFASWLSCTKEAVAQAPLSNRVGQKEPLRLIILIHDQWRRAQTYCLSIIDSEEWAQVLLFSFWGSWRWVWGAGVDLWLSETWADKCVNLDMMELPVINVKANLSVPSVPLMLGFSSSTGFCWLALSPSSLVALSLFASELLARAFNKSYQYSWYRSSNRAPVLIVGSRIYTLGLS